MLVAALLTGTRHGKGSARRYGDCLQLVPMPLKPAVAELVCSRECHTIRIQEGFKGSGCAHLPITHRSRVDLIHVSSCISLDPYCFKDLAFFFPLVVPSGLIFLSPLVFP